VAIRSFLSGGYVVNFGKSFKEGMMDTYAVKPVFSGRFRQIPLSVRVPGSKSITNRALMIAALADGTTLLRGAQFSSDAQHFMQCL